MQLGKLGVWAPMDALTAAEGALFAQKVEEWGYAALWLPESRGRNVLAHSAWLLANTKELIVAPGIANIYARDPMAMANGQRGLNEQSDGRFLLGIGVSHAPTVTGLRGHQYGKPVATMRSYLREMQLAPYLAPDPPEKPLTILAALGPRMLALSAELADGAHPYNVPPEHTAEARKILGSGKLLCPEVWVLLETDPAKARSAARQALCPTCSSIIMPITGVGSALETTFSAAAPIGLSMPMSPGVTRARSASASRSIGMPAPTMSASRRSARTGRAGRMSGCWRCWRPGGRPAAA